MVRHYTIILITVLLLTVSGVANAQEEYPHLPGTVQATGEYFEVADSDYLNIKLESDKTVTAKIESMPEMVILELEVLSDKPVVNLKISGFPANTTFHKYEDDYHNYAPVITDEEGVFSFDTDLSQKKIIFIQPRKSTKFIKDDATGGDCGNIGSWSAAAKTCTLNQDVGETIQIDNDYVTLDGNGHTLTGLGSGSGVNVSNKTQVKVKNLNIESFSSAVRYYASSGKIENLLVENNYHGITLPNSNYVEIKNNNVRSNESTGIYLSGANHNIVSENTIGPGNYIGIMQSAGGYRFSQGNSYINNNILENEESGVAIGGSLNDSLLGNRINGNGYYGVYVINNEITTVKNNSLAGNGKNLHLEISEDLSGHDIDNSNTVEGKNVLYAKNISGGTYDDSQNIGTLYCVNCENITVKDVALADNESQIVFWNTNNSLIEGTWSQDKKSIVYFYGSSGNTIRKNSLGKIYIYGYSHDNMVVNNNFYNAIEPAYSCSSCANNTFYLNLPIGGNYWKINEPNCNDNNEDGFCDSSYYFFFNRRDKYPLAGEIAIGSPFCCSSVLFLPGHQASRLYKKHALDEDQLWEPTNRNEDVRDLFLNPETGESLDENIYTRDIVDEVYGVSNNIYKKFISFMDDQVQEGLISDWEPIPYDWRLPLEKIVDEGVKLKDGNIIDIIQQVRELATSSKTRKVTLIAHSNGGLLAKELINKLRETGEENLVDKIIFVAVPQIGTPKAAVAILHGDEINVLHSILVDKRTAREFAESMASVYNLLPSQKYFDFVESPVVEFEEDVGDIYDFRSFYEEDINSWDEFRKFLRGDDGERTDPERGDTDSPNVLPENFLSQAEETHNNLDNWQAPEGTEVVQIAGWGLDTIRGIRYDDCDFFLCPDKLSNLDRSLIMTEDGDETVVVPSAVAMGDTVKTYYLNLSEYNKIGKFQVNKDHASILEVDSLRELIIEEIQGDNIELPDYISSKKPTLDDNKRFRIRLYSPVKIDIYDENGNHTGLIENNDPDSDLRFLEEQIPNSYYIEFGEKKYAGMDGAFDADIMLTGEDLGTFTLEVDEVFGTGETVTTSFANIPVSKKLEATLAIGDNVGDLNIDVDGDGETDFVIQPGEGINQLNSLEILQKTITVLDIHQTVKDRLANKVDNAIKQMEKGHTMSVNAMLENVIQQIETFSRDKTNDKYRISAEDAEKLIEMVQKIKTMD